jgi:hypothetical protein
MRYPRRTHSRFATTGSRLSTSSRAAASWTSTPNLTLSESAGSPFDHTLEQGTCDCAQRIILPRSETTTRVPVTSEPGTLRWAFIEVTDPWDAENLIRATVADLKSAAVWDGHDRPPRSGNDPPSVA